MTWKLRVRNQHAVSMNNLRYNLAGSDYTHKEKVTVLGNLSDLVSSIEAGNDRFLSTSKIPMPFSGYDPPLYFSTDVKAWGETLDYPFCKRHVAFPRMRTRWGTVSTAGAFCDWISPSNGECTFIKILSGKQYVVIATPGDDMSFPRPFTDYNDWNIDGVVLEEGTMVSVMICLIIRKY
jgi:hypothetical protein